MKMEKTFWKVFKNLKLNQESLGGSGKNSLNNALSPPHSIMMTKLHCSYAKDLVEVTEDS